MRRIALLATSLAALLWVAPMLGCAAGLGEQEKPAFAKGEPPPPSVQGRAREQAPSPGVTLMSSEVTPEQAEKMKRDAAKRAQEEKEAAEQAGEAATAP